MKRQAFLGFVCAVGGWLLPQPARAQANYEDVILGGRTAMMGGAAVAKGSDGATAFVNPAGLIRIPGQSFAFSTVAMQMTSRNVSSNMDPSNTLGSDGGQTYDFNLNILPNTFCLFLDGPPKDDYSGRSRHKYGICYANTENTSFAFANNTQGRPLFEFGPNSSLGLSSRSFFARSSLAFAWGFDLFKETHIGVTARVDNSRFQDETAVSSFANYGLRTDLQSMAHSSFGSSWDSSITVGATHEVNKVVTLGVSLSTPSLHLLGNYIATDSFVPVGTDPRSLSQDVGDFRYNQPSTLRMGLAFSWPMLNVEVNGNFYGTQEVLAMAKFDRSVTTVIDGQSAQVLGTPDQIVERSRPVVNLAAGLEAFLEPDFSIIGGVQTDFSGLTQRADAISADETLFRQRLNAIHASIGAVSYGSAGSLLLGFRGFYGGGEILVPDASGITGYFRSVPQSQWGLSFVISGQISFEAVRDTAARAAAPLLETPDEEEVKP